MERCGPRSSARGQRRAPTARRVTRSVVIVALVALMCVSYFGFEDDETVHVVAGTALLAVLALKIAVIRRWHRLGRFLPLLGISVFVLLGITWLSSAGAFLADQ
jgi:Family of unknown function (DUF6529)